MILLSNAIDTEIYLSHPVCPEESKYLIDKLECAYLAKIRFLNFEITFQDYLDILEICNVDIDDYLKIIDINLQLLQVA